MTNINDLIQKINESFEGTKSTEIDPTKYWNLSEEFNALETTLRENIQAQTAGEVRGVIGKLRANEELTEEDLNLIKLWICGEAEYYVKMENDYEGWQKEIIRLVAEVNKYGDQELDYQKASEVRALSLDAMRVIGDIMFYQKQKQRVQNFIESTETVEPEERDFLIQLLEGKLRSNTE